MHGKYNITLRVNVGWCGGCARYQDGFCVFGIHGVQRTTHYMCWLISKDKEE
jgi:hypothetical protein